MNTFRAFLVILFSTLAFQSFSQDLPKGTAWLIKEGNGIKVHTYMSPEPMFANTSHVIELKDQLIVVDGQFFSPYAFELKAFTDKLGKKISRFYISHDHPDHYIGFGDAFPDVAVYALEETKVGIEKDGQSVLEQRQKQFGPMIAKTLNAPKFSQKEGKETISGVSFIFEKSVGNESANSLIIKIPTLGVYIAQDIVYNNVHLFIEGNTQGWEKALNKIKSDKKYSVILGGHGKEGGLKLINDNLAYLAFVNESLKNTKTKAEFKSKIMTKYPTYAGEQLVDIYLAYYLQNENWK